MEYGKSNKQYIKDFLMIKPLDMSTIFDLKVAARFLILKFAR